MAMLSHLAYPYKRRGGRSSAAVNTISLAHFNGDDGATTTEDLIYGVTWTLSGTNQLDTAQVQFGTASLLFPTVGDLVSGTPIPNISAGDWTIESFVRTSAATGNRTPKMFFLDSAPANVLVAFLIADDVGGDLVTWTITDSVGVPIVDNSVTVTATADAWFHLAVVRSGTNYFLYFDGNRVDSSVSVTNMGPTASIQFSINSAEDGWLDEFRVSKIARYTGATYTVPTTEFTVD